MLNPGDIAPVLPAPVSAGGWRVLFFFPRIQTVHCEMQARRFEALMKDFQALGVSIAGVSTDPDRTHTSFLSVCRLSYPLVSDAEGSVAAAFGVLEDDLVEDEKTLRAQRRTFLLDPAGKVVKRYDEVDPNTHAADVLSDVKALVSS